MQASSLGILECRDDRRNEMRSGHQVDGGRTECLKLKHQVGKLLICQSHPVPALLADLVVLAVLTVKRTSAEEDHAGSLLSGHRRLLSPVKA